MDLHPNVKKGIQEIDAQLFSAETDNKDLNELEEYVDRWKRRIAVVRESNGDEED